MESTKYVGMDVHTEAISVAVRNSAGKVRMESILETKANTILEFIQGLRGNVHVMLHPWSSEAARQRSPAWMLLIPSVDGIRLFTSRTAPAKHRAYARGNRVRGKTWQALQPRSVYYARKRLEGG